MRSLFFCCLLLITYSSNAQNALAYATPEDFMAQTYRQYDIVVMPNETPKRKEWQGIKTYTILTGKSSTDHAFKDNYFAVEHHDSLFINCSKLIGVDCYANVVMRCRNYIFFTSVASRRKEHKESLYRNKDQGKAIATTAILGAVGGLAGVAIGYGTGAISSDSDPNVARLKYCYIYNLETNNTYVMTPALMTDMLENRKDLQEQYINGGQPDNESMYRYYLEQLYK